MIGSQVLRINGELSAQKNVWQCSGDTLFLTYQDAGVRPGDESDLYWIETKQLDSAAEICQWLAQLLEKNWATDKILSDFVRAVDIVVGLHDIR
jgi:hypothetical protein